MSDISSSPAYYQLSPSIFGTTIKIIPCGEVNGRMPTNEKIGKHNKTNLYYSKNQILRDYNNRIQNSQIPTFKKDVLNESSNSFFLTIDHLFNGIKELSFGLLLLLLLPILPLFYIYKLFLSKSIIKKIEDENEIASTSKKRSTLNSIEDK